MPKVNADFVIDQYRSGIENYRTATKDLGLWASEHYVFEKYLSLGEPLLDVGCGAGRTTYALHQMGHTDIVGIDLTPEMITAAISLADHFETVIDFRVGDATNLSFEDNAFGAVVFSFNGMMSIPEQRRRDKALQEIWRVLKPGGVFLFTTHDRDKDENYLEFWKQQTEKWQAGERDERLYQFGDLITSSKNEEREIFIHIPSRAEIWDWLTANGFTVMETFFRSDRFHEREAVLKASGECRFWVAYKG